MGIGVSALFSANMEFVAFNKAIALNQRSSALGANAKNNSELEVVTESFLGGYKTPSAPIGITADVLNGIPSS